MPVDYHHHLDSGLSNPSICHSHFARHGSSAHGDRDSYGLGYDWNHHQVGPRLRRNLHQHNSVRSKALQHNRTPTGQKNESKPSTNSPHRNVEYTSTVYTGNYTSSTLRASTSCAPASSFVYVWPGTTTETYTQYLYASTTTAPAVTLPTQATEWATDSARTETIDGYCTTTILSTTATASTAATQALKCAPTNLIGTDGLSHSRSGYRGLPEDGIAWYGRSGPSPPGYDRDFATGAHKDASACCQACQEDPKCVASIWSGTSSTYPSPSVPGCDFYYGSTADGEGEETCGLGFLVYKGDKQIAQSGGCGYVAETVFSEGICPEGLTPGECDKQGYPGRYV
jgi:hypothetical protein